MSRFVKFKKYASDKYDVKNKKNNYRIGQISFYSVWKKWVFETWDGNIFDAECLNDIAVFMRGLNE